MGETSGSVGRILSARYARAMPSSRFRCMTGSRPSLAAYDADEHVMSSQGEARTIAAGSTGGDDDDDDAPRLSMPSVSAPPDDSPKMATCAHLAFAPATGTLVRWSYAALRSSSAAGKGCSGARRSVGVATGSPVRSESFAARWRPARGDPVTNMPPWTRTTIAGRSAAVKALMAGRLATTSVLTPPQSTMFTW